MSKDASPWVFDWLSEERYAKYLRAAGGAHDRALQLYGWNSRLAAALMSDLGHLEIGLRNAYDRALLAHPLCRGRDWLDPQACSLLFPRHEIADDRGGWRDKNAAPRQNIRAARQRAGVGSGKAFTRGKVIAELMFGFWSYLSDGLHEKTLWVPALHGAYAPGTDRARIHGALGELRGIRNRLAHHESVFDQKPENIRRRIVYVARSISEELSQHITDQSDVRRLLGERP